MEDGVEAIGPRPHPPWGWVSPGGRWRQGHEGQDATPLGGLAKKKYIYIYIYIYVYNIYIYIYIYKKNPYPRLTARQGDDVFIGEKIPPADRAYACHGLRG